MIRRADTAEGRWSQGIVKSVRSGDSIVVIGPVPSVTADAQFILPPEKLLTLSHVAAPRVGQRGSPDEPWASHSREYLRSHIIGRPVTFRVEDIAGASRREFASVAVGGEDLAGLLVAAGWVRVLEGGPQHGAAMERREELRSLQEEARTSKYGIWSEDPALTATAVRDVNNAPGLGDFTGSLSGASTLGVVEHVRDCACLRVVLRPWSMPCTIFLAGVQGPRANGGNIVKGGDDILAAGESKGGQDNYPEPFALEARFFSEMNVLQREIQVTVRGVDKGGNALAKVDFQRWDPQRQRRVIINLSEELLRLGFAKIAEWSLSALSPLSGEHLRSLERQARAARLRVWRNYSPPASGTTSEGTVRTFPGRVLEVISGDQVIIVSADGTEIALTLASLRAPRMGSRKRGTPAEPWAIEARSFLISKLLDVPLEIHLEYSRGAIPPGQGGALPILYGSLLLQDGGHNVGAFLTAEGLATVIRHRGDEERSKFYLELLEGESAAKAALRGIHSKIDPPAARVNDLSQGTSTLAKAQQMLPFLHRKAALKATVEYILTAGRMRLSIPSQSCIIIFALSLVKVAHGGDGDDGHVRARGALQKVRALLLHRSVVINVEFCDKTGAMVGTMSLNGSDVAMRLISEGVVTVNSSINPSRVPYGTAYFEAQANAKIAQRGLWRDWVESSQLDKAIHPANVPVEVHCCATEICDASKFFIQFLGTTTSQHLENCMDTLNAASSPPPPPIAPRLGLKCLALYSNDQRWYRAVITSHNRSKENYVVEYYDYGNSESIPYDEIGLRFGALTSELAELPPVGAWCTLCGLKVPTLDADYGPEAADFFYSIIGSGAKLLCIIPDPASGERAGTLQDVYLYDEKKTSCVNEIMVENGFALIRRKSARDHPSDSTYSSRLDNLQENAHVKRRGMWQYGDVNDDDLDETTR